VPAERQLWLPFEDLVKEPRELSERMCTFLGLAFDEGMLKPHEGDGRMTDGTREGAKMQGDPRFHEHKGINAQVADQWKQEFSESMLAGMTRELAQRLGYDVASARPESPAEVRTAQAAPILRRRSSRSVPERVSGGIDQLAGADVDALLRGMLAGRKKNG
jgi:hypothetical protein